TLLCAFTAKDATHAAERSAEAAPSAPAATTPFTAARLASLPRSVLRRFRRGAEAEGFAQAQIDRIESRPFAIIAWDDRLPRQRIQIERPIRRDPHARTR